ncbi:nucleotidyl transferase AbiEii/AbiGii toxin family protein [Nocardioides terrisoli]|uniref:nucleotidyl transferase AbiEii/AbiGii toxin family protein n=1 Tax=Nocardioides terrisoli TaxID=3388267 RepID=UPI0037C57964
MPWSPTRAPSRSRNGSTPPTHHLPDRPGRHLLRPRRDRGLPGRRWCGTPGLRPDRPPHRGPRPLRRDTHDVRDTGQGRVRAGTPQPGLRRRHRPRRTHVLQAGRRTGGGEQTLVDLAIDSPPHSRPTITVLGPTLAPLELAGRKLLALFGRAEARDFADVYVLAQRFGTAALIEQTQELDAGFDPGVLAQMIGTIGRFEDHEIPLVPEELPPARSFFADWASELG